MRALRWKHVEEEDDNDNSGNGNASNGPPGFETLIEGLRTELDIAKQREEDITASIRIQIQKTENLIGGNATFQRIFDQAVARINADFERAEGNSRQLASSLQAVSGLAQNISDRVAALDLGKSRVVECLQRVNDLRDLGTCANGVQEAIRHEKYEEAAKHIHRFLTLDTAVFKMGDQPETKDAGYSVKNCYEVLRKASAELKSIIEHKFDSARAKGDVASMERFFKLFPLINEHQSGLQRFGNHLRAKIADLGEQYYRIMQAGGTDDKRRNVLYADTLTLIFEEIARTIELHQPIIDNFYGQDKLLDLIEIIQPECDAQSTKVLNAFIQKRSFEEKARQVSELFRSDPSLYAGKIDAIELDVLLSEVTLMHTRAELFWRFLKRRLNRQTDKGKEEYVDRDLGTVKESLEGEGDFESEEQSKAHLEKVKAIREDRARKLDSVLNRSGLNTKMQELLGKYVLMEQFFMTQSVHKAISMDTVEEGSLTSSLLDDVFFIVRKSIRRSISSSSVDCICAMLNNGVTLLETDFLKYICMPLKAGYQNISWTSEAYQTAQSAYTAVIQQGKGEIASADKQRAAFLTAVNNLRASIDCVNALKTGLGEDFSKHLNQMSSIDNKKLDNSVGQMDDFVKHLEQHANLAVGKLCDSIFGVKLKSLLEQYLELEHIISDEQLAYFELNDPFMSNFIMQLDKNIAQFEPLLSPENYHALACSISAETIDQMERIVFKCTFNRFGALQLDKEFRELTSYLTSLAGWNIREKFTRLSQIIALLNSENLEEALQFLQQLQNNSLLLSINLPHNDIRRTLLLRCDFQREQIVAKLKSLKS